MDLDDLPVFLPNHITLSSETPDQLVEVYSLSPLSTVQPLSLEYFVDAYPHILPWLYQWTSLTGLKLDFACPSADILTDLNPSLTCLTKLRFLIVKVECQPGKLDLVGLNQLESLEVDAHHLDLSSLATLNLKQLKMTFSDEASRCQPFTHLNSLISLTVYSKKDTDLSELFTTLHHMPELRKLRLDGLHPKWVDHLTKVMPPKLKALDLQTSGGSHKIITNQILNDLLLSLPVDLHEFDTDLILWDSPGIGKWLDSWSGAFRKSPVDLYQPDFEDFPGLAKAYTKCTHMMELILSMYNVGEQDQEVFDSIEHLFTNATQFRKLDFRFRYPDEVMMTALSTVANHVVHLKELTIEISRFDDFPKAFFKLRFPELEELELSGYKFQEDKWSLLCSFLKGNAQLKYVAVDLNAWEATGKEAQLVWDLFPLTLDDIHVTIDGPDYDYLETLPAFLGESRWQSLIITLDATFPSQFTFPPTALWIQDLSIRQVYEFASQPHAIRPWLAANQNRHQTLEALVTPQEPDWCHPDWEDLV